MFATILDIFTGMIGSKVDIHVTATRVRATVGVHVAVLLFFFHPGRWYDRKREDVRK